MFLQLQGESHKNGNQHPLINNLQSNKIKRKREREKENHENFNTMNEQNNVGAHFAGLRDCGRRRGVAIHHLRSTTIS